MLATQKGKDFQVEIDVAQKAEYTAMAGTIQEINGNKHEIASVSFGKEWQPKPQWVDREDALSYMSPAAISAKAGTKSGWFEAAGSPRCYAYLTIKNAPVVLKKKIEPKAIQKPALIEPKPVMLGKITLMGPITSVMLWASEEEASKVATELKRFEVDTTVLPPNDLGRWFIFDINKNPGVIQALAN